MLERFIVTYVPVECVYGIAREALVSHLIEAVAISPSVFSFVMNDFCHA